MNMHGAQLETQLPAHADEKMKQDGGIQSARIAKAEPGLRRKSGGEKIPDPTGKVSGPGFP